MLSKIGWAVVLVVPLWALYAVFMLVPNEATMGAVQRIFYFHVASAFTAFIAFFAVMVMSIAYLRGGNPSWDRRALAAVEVGVVFLTIVLVTGPLWARPVWGAFWVWQDARLVTTLILWIYFVLYLFLRRSWRHDPSGLRFAAVMAIIGFVDVPIVYFAVKWWNFTHPGHVMGPAGGGLHPAMARAMLISFAAVFSIGVALWVRRVRLERLSDRVDDLIDRAQARPQGV